MGQEKIIEKIKKLLVRTTENGCTPGEAATAAAQVAMLLAKHNLSMQDVGGEDNTLLEEDVPVGTKSCSPYQALIAGKLESHFGVTTFLRGVHSNNKTFKKLMVYGEKIKVQAFLETFSFIYKAYQNCWKSYHSSKNLNTSEKNGLRLPYLQGFIEGVIAEIVKEENKYSLVVQKSTAVSDFEKSLKKGHRFSCVYTHSDEAEARGYSDGVYCQANKNKCLD